jgi:putative oxidoreductase
MALSRSAARPLLSAMFIFGGLESLRHPGPKVKAAEAVTGSLTERFPGLPSDPRTLIRINGAVQVGAGVLLATGRFRRLAAVALIGSIIPTTYAGHRFWEEPDDVARAQQTAHFLKNAGLLGGLILAAVDTEGRPSLGWRARRRARQIGRGVRGAEERLTKAHQPST